jgi:hypothetical protein
MMPIGGTAISLFFNTFPVRSIPCTHSLLNRTQSHSAVLAVIIYAGRTVKNRTSSLAVVSCQAEWTIKKDNHPYISREKAQ